VKNSIKAVLGVTAALALGGCVAVPVGGAYYEPAPAATYYAPAPAYYGPSIGIGIYGGRSYGGSRGGPRRWR
jgi:hypothetical protein